jgi:hypothetical protein
MKQLIVLPRGGLGDILYHALFASYVREHLPEFEPVLLAPAYGTFLSGLLRVRHIPVSSFLSDATNGIRIRSEVNFFSTLLRQRGASMASFTNDVIDCGLLRLCGFKRFDNKVLGNSTLAFANQPGRFSRYKLNAVLKYKGTGTMNPAHIVDRQRTALDQYRAEANLPAAYRDIWLRALDEKIQPPDQAGVVLIFPETARAEKNLTVAQVRYIARHLRRDYTVRVFTRYPAAYSDLGIETAGFADRWGPLRQIRSAAAVFTADTFAAHVAGLCGTPTYTIYNFAYKPRWCEYWGAPFENVLHFEAGECYRLTDAFAASHFSEDSDLFHAALGASQQLPDAHALDDAPVLTGCAVR